MHELASEQAESIVQKAAPGYRLASVEPAAGSFTNDARVLECRAPDGGRVRLVVKFLVDEPDSASRCAVASFHALQLAQRHEIPVPEPFYLDETGETLGVPGIVTGFVEGQQIAAPRDVGEWADTLAMLLARIHSVRPDGSDRARLIDGNHEALFMLRGDWPERKAEHPLSDEIYAAIRQLHPGIRPSPSRLIHIDYWPGNVLWHRGKVSAVVDWDHAAFGDPAIDVAYFRLNMYLRGIKPAADAFLRRYEEATGAVVRNLGFWEIVAAARPLPEPVRWIPASREMGDAGATDDRADTDYYEFVRSALARAGDNR